MLSTISAVKALAHDHPDWLDVVQASYQQSLQTNEFAGAWVLRRLGRWMPSLRMLARYGILEKVETA